MSIGKLRHRLASLLLLLPFSMGTALASPAVPAPPQVSASHYILQDFHTGHVLAEKGADERVEPASITKLMSAYLVFRELKEGRLTLDTPVTISKKAWKMPGSRTFVEVGKRVPVEVLLKGMIIQSGNDATVALAEQVAGSEDTFASLMNQQAEALGMTGTHFVNSTGLPDPEHYTTARDIATLARAVIRDFPDYYRLYSEKKFTWNNITQYNRNKLLWRDKSVDGIKTGHTESAGYCLTASALRDGMRLVSVVLGDKSEEARATSTQALLNYGFRFFETRRLYDAGATLKEIRVWKGTVEQLPLGLDAPLWLTFPRGHYKSLEAVMERAEAVTAPVAEGVALGTLQVKLEGEVLAEEPLVALQAVPEGSLWQQLRDSVLLWFE